MPLSTALRGPRGVWLGLILLLAVAWLCYWPGLSGGFLFDDFVNLDALGNRGPIDNWPAFWRYITAGSADPLGRPLALLSFLLDARDWPADPAPFLRTNVLLHLLNGALLFVLLRRLGEALDGVSRRNDAIALLAAGLWLLHPLFVSTTLYIVQREAMLPATVTLLALCLFASGRLQYRDSDGRTGLRRMTLALVAGTGLAALCKANGILLPLLAWTLVATVFKPGEAALTEPARARLQRWDRVLLVLPGLVVFAYLLHFLPQLNVDLVTRPWTIGQRLLTEPRVLLDYLVLLAVPRAVSTGLFNDEYAVSHDWLHPASTLPAMALIVGLIIIALRCRERAPRLSAALLFLFAGLLLESTVVPLELFFEHRNYLPAMLLFWPVAHALAGWRIRPGVRTTVACALLALFALTTWQRASLWGQPDQMMAIWAKRNPGSPRAQASVAIDLVKAGRPDEAAQSLLPLWRRSPDEVQLAFNYVNARCAGAGLEPSDAAKVSETLRQAKSGGLLVHKWLNAALEMATTGACPGLTLPQVETWIDAAMQNPVLGAEGAREQDLEPLLGELAVYRNQPALALQYFSHALQSFPNPDFAARLISFLAEHDQQSTALTLLDRYEHDWQKAAPAAPWLMPRLHAKVMDRQQFWPHEFAVLRGKLEEDIASQQAIPATSGPPAAPAHR